MERWNIGTRWNIAERYGTKFPHNSLIQNIVPSVPCVLINFLLFFKIVLKTKKIINPSLIDVYRSSCGHTFGWTHAV